MSTRSWLLTTLTLLLTCGAAVAALARPAQDDARLALAGEWLYVEDRT